MPMAVYCRRRRRVECRKRGYRHRQLSIQHG